MERIAIVGASRTAIGRFGGSFKNTSAVDLGVAASKAALAKAGLDASQVDELILGNVLGAGQGMNPSRQVLLGTGGPIESGAFTINKVCGSGLKAIMLGAQALAMGEGNVILAGGAENMSRAPYVSNASRWGARLGGCELADSILSEGLTDVFSGKHMGITAENLAEKYSISREEQDEFALASQEKALAAIESGRFADEITPVDVKVKREMVAFATDEHPRAGTTLEGLAKLRPAFKKDGSVTAGNASGINDAAAMVALMRESDAKAAGIEPMAFIKSYAFAGVDPSIMGIGPVPSSLKALEKAGLKQSDIQVAELNEAFAAQALAVMRELTEINPEVVNVNGGAIALGHPIGASGSRVLITLLFEMIKRDLNLGLASLCIGGGQGVAMILER